MSVQADCARISGDLPQEISKVTLSPEVDRENNSQAIYKKIHLKEIGHLVRQVFRS